jgi:hypothetical protein
MEKINKNNYKLNTSQMINLFQNNLVVKIFKFLNLY